MVVRFVALAGAFGCSGVAAQTGPPWPEPLVDDVTTLIERGDRVDAIWPGFWTEPRPFIVMAPDGAYLFAQEAPPPGFSPVPEGSIPPTLLGFAYSSDRPFRGPVPTVGGALVMPVNLAGPGGILPNGASQLEGIVHETFHAWQLANWSRPLLDTRSRCVPQRYDEAGVTLPPAFAEAVADETAALADALSASDADRPDRIRRFLDVRRRRIEAAGPIVGAIDRRQERLEGAAQLVGLWAGIALREGGAAGAREAVGDSLVATLRAHPAQARAEGATPSREAAARAYHVGAATLFLLDGLPTGDWRRGIARGDFPDTWLARSVRMDGYVEAIREGEARVCEGR